MPRTNRRSVLVFALVALFTATLSPAAVAATYVNPPAATHIHMSICPALDGANILDPDPATPVGVASLAMVNELAAGDTAYPGWMFQSAIGPLSGTFNIDRYDSRFWDVHNSGAVISIRFVRGLTDPPAANLRWIQLINTNSPIDPNGPGAAPGPPTPPYIDPYPDDADLEGGPFYYSDEFGSEWDYRDHINGANYDANFGDFSHRPHPPTSYVEWSAELFLTELSAPKNVIFHEGVLWGWKAACINWLSLIGLTMGISTPGPASVMYDPATEKLQISVAPINVLNQSGSFTGVDPIFAHDPVLNAQMIFAPFTRIHGAELPPGLALFGGGSVQVIGSGVGLLYTARIPYLVLGDDMNLDYNMTGVLADISVPPTTSAFLNQYESFRHAGEATLGTLKAGGTSDRSHPDGRSSEVGTYPFQNAGHSPQLYIRSSVPVATLLAIGGSSPAAVYNSFGTRNPEGGLLLRVDRTALSWGDLGTKVVYDVVRGDLGLLRSTGDFSIASQQCVADDASTPSVSFMADPVPGMGFWFVARAKRGIIVGSYDTPVPSQFASRDPGIAAAPPASRCP